MFMARLRGVFPRGMYTKKNIRKKNMKKAPVKNNGFPGSYRNEAKIHS